MLSKFVSKNQKDWDQYLPVLMMAYRSSVHESMGFTLNEMMFGHEVLRPLDLVIGQAEPSGDSSETEYAAKLSEQMERIYQFARQHLKMSSDRQKNYYHPPVNQHRYNRGDAVWLYSPKKVSALS